MFDKPIVCDSYCVSAKLLVQFLKTRDGQVMGCDDPESRRLGFIWFYPDKGISVLNRIGLTEVKCADDEDRDFILKFHKRLIEQQTI